MSLSPHCYHGVQLNAYWISVLRQAKFETTAAEAERSAPNRAVAQEVEHNADQAQGVAKQAALAAHVSPG